MGRGGSSWCCNCNWRSPPNNSSQSHPQVSFSPNLPWMVFWWKSQEGQFYVFTFCSSCSEFFHEVLVTHPHQRPLLYLKDVAYRCKPVFLRRTTWSDIQCKDLNQAATLGPAVPLQRRVPGETSLFQFLNCFLLQPRWIKMMLKSS